MNIKTSLPLPPTEPARSIYRNVYAYHLSEIAALIFGARKYPRDSSTYRSLMQSARQHAVYIRAGRHAAKLCEPK